MGLPPLLTALLTLGLVTASPGWARDLGALEQRATAGDPKAALALGLAYDGGDGTPASLDLAYRWYVEAALAGEASAQFNVAIFLDSGRGVTRDPKAAALWYGRAAARGHLRARYNLAQLYDLGEGVPKNPVMAARWYATVAGELPAARERIAALQPAIRASDGGVLEAPAPMADVPFIEPRDRSAQVELVWTMPSQPPDSRTFIEVVRLDRGAPKPVVARFEERSATLLELPPGPAAYGWRVTAVDPRRERYAPGPWQGFSVGGARPVTRTDLTVRLASLPPPAPLAGLEPVAVPSAPLRVTIGAPRPPAPSGLVTPIAASRTPF